jgi:(p)ppGpp synthase/HD superfamily hydrolase
MTLSSDFDDALAMASRIHRKQFRKGSDTPYIAHLLAVTAIALEHGATENEAIAAVLHDAPEDQGGAKRLGKIHKRFGRRVAQIVEGCSDTLERPKPPWSERKEAFVSRLDTAPYSVRLVVAADKLHNARAIGEDYLTFGEDLWSRFTGGRDGTLWYYRAVVDALIGSLNADETQLAMLISELDRTVSELGHPVTLEQSVESAGG